LLEENGLTLPGSKGNGIDLSPRQGLAGLLVEFAETLTTDLPIQGILDHLTKRILDVLPVKGAGVMLMGEDEEMHFVSASDDILLQVEGLQIELDEGPCLEAYRTGERVLISDLRSDARFRRFGPRAVEDGLGAVFSFPMRINGVRIGAADLYAAEPMQLSPEDAAIGQLLADVAAAYVMNARGRAASQQVAQQLRYLAQHDPLTHLPNRSLFYDRIEHAVARSRRGHGMLAVLFIDLDGFKTINDNLGHKWGDQLLIGVAGRLSDTLREGDTLARLGGDEFVVLCEDLHETENAVPVAERINDALTAPFRLGDREVHVTASIGMAFAREGPESPEDLVEEADRAMYRAKRLGGARFEVIEPEARSHALRRLEDDRGLRRAIERAELRLLYQPIVSVADGGLHGAEALLRWVHPERGLLEPAAFLPLAEETGLIVPIGQWVLSEACRAMVRGSRPEGPAGPSLSVNVSARQLADPQFTDVVRAVIDLTGSDPSRICLDLNETVFIDEGVEALDVLGEVKRLGVRLAIDDFGTGYASLTHLRRFPIDVIKLDRTFVDCLDSNSRDAAIVSSVVNLAHDLGLTVIAEGIETDRQLALIGELECDLAQGYLLSRPLEEQVFRDRVWNGAEGPAPAGVPRRDRSLS
jgi:diguanylate cyclase (GGDEF)-like protein